MAEISTVSLLENKIAQAQRNLRQNVNEISLKRQGQNVSFRNVIVKEQPKSQQRAVKLKSNFFTVHNFFLLKIGHWNVLALLCCLFLVYKLYMN
jgi:hypothetical protein